MVFVSILSVLPKSLSVLLVQVAVTQQVAAARPEVEDDELSDTMFLILFKRSWHLLNHSDEQGARFTL